MRHLLEYSSTAGFTEASVLTLTSFTTATGSASTACCENPLALKDSNRAANAVRLVFFMSNSWCFSFVLFMLLLPGFPDQLSL
jgi:hypothetical protein